MKVFKFGGSSVASPERISGITSWFARLAENEACRAVVFSAFQGVTDQLVSMAERAGRGDDSYIADLGQLEARHIDAVKSLLPGNRTAEPANRIKYMLNDLEDILQGVYLVKELTPRSLDFICSFGERLSNYIISLVFNQHDIPSDFVDARKLVLTDNQFGNAEVDMEKTMDNIRSHFAVHPKLQIVTGFIAATEEGVTTTLGRGGSDYTAAIIAAALDARELQIWTDVDGVLTSDPRVVREAFSMDVLSYEEAMEMSHFGAKVIYPPTIEPAMRKGIPIRIKNTLNPEFPGTIVGTTDSRQAHIIRGISSVDHVALIRVQGSGMVGMAGISQRIFGALATGKVNIILITQGSSEHSVCLAVSPKDAAKAKKLLETELKHDLEIHRVADIIVEDDLSIIAVVGENMRQTPGIAGKVFQALGRSRINISAIAQGSSELNISAVIRRVDRHKALRVIHDAFFYGPRKTAHIYIIGAGLIGSQLIRDIYQRQPWLLKERHLDLRICGIANSRTMLLRHEGIPADNWQDLLRNSGQKSDLQQLFHYVKENQSPFTVIVDTTASHQPVEWYPHFLGQGIAVVTPNKIANTGPADLFIRLHELAIANDTRFLYETTAGAGLPFVQAVRDRVASGDPIQRLEGVFSGTLSYLFNTYDGSMPFSKLVQSARDQGFTEPDPRDDLNGLDAARKLLLLARITGSRAEIDDVQVENLVPKRLRKPDNDSRFLAKLADYDADFEKIRSDAEKKKARLRYLAVMGKNQLSVKLTAVKSDHPAWDLKGSENLLAVTTDAYTDPLVIKGSGAGPVVTANGVLNDILKVID